ncbi:MAG TPA: OsmC family protein, partial [Candidatus Thalassarchaeaceae archaeon]|nr:OsmC family protein [Candidatus Thalassarchaeaceae archaeon]
KNRELIYASVDMDLERSETNPRVFTKINMIYRVRGVDLPEKLVTRLIEHSHAKYCTISNMLKHTAEITWEAIIE